MIPNALAAAGPIKRAFQKSDDDLAGGIGDAARSRGDRTASTSGLPVRTCRPDGIDPVPSRRVRTRLERCPSAAAPIVARGSGGSRRV